MTLPLQSSAPAPHSLDEDALAKVDQGAAALPVDSDAEAAEIAEGIEDEDRTPGWRMALLLVSSALLSGIAVVVWNRRSLQQMRQTQTQPEPVVEPGEFI